MSLKLASDVLVDVRRQARVPDNDPSDADILASANEVLLAVCSPFVRRFQEEFWVAPDNDQSLVADRNDYFMPARASSLRDVVYVDGNDNEYDMPYIAPEDAPLFHTAAGSSWPSRYGFTIRGDSVILLPTPKDAVGKLRIRYYWRPGKLVNEANKVTAVTATDVTYTGTGTGFASNVKYDVVRSKAGFALLLDEKNATKSGSVLTFTSTGRAAVDDYVSLAGETPVVQLPPEVYPMLIAGTARRVLEARGDREGASIVAERLREEKTEVAELMEPRVDGAIPTIVNWSSPTRSRWR